MNILFRFQCTCCGKEKLADAVLLKCCDQLMKMVGHVSMTTQEIHKLMNKL